jgi:hypothetical protein
LQALISKGALGRAFWSAGLSIRMTIHRGKKGEFWRSKKWAGRGGSPILLP